MITWMLLLGFNGYGDYIGSGFFQELWLGIALNTNVFLEKDG
jgi:hypothetical protein